MKRRIVVSLLIGVHNMQVVLASDQYLYRVHSRILALTPQVTVRTIYNWRKKMETQAKIPSARVVVCSVCGYWPRSWGKCPDCKHDFSRTIRMHSSQISNVVGNAKMIPAVRVTDQHLVDL
jgi:hypothetical protein